MKDFIDLLIIGLVIFGVYILVSKYVRKKMKNRNMKTPEDRQYEKILKKYKEEMKAGIEEMNRAKTKAEVEAKTRAYIKSADRLPGRFHINFEGKIYPCNAKVFRCPYGEDSHSTNKLELYSILMERHGVDAKPPKSAMYELRTYNRLTNLKPLSDSIETADCPIEVIVVTLNEAISHIKNIDIDSTSGLDSNFWKDFERRVFCKKKVQDIAIFYTECCHQRFCFS